MSFDGFNRFRWLFFPLHNYDSLNLISNIHGVSVQPKYITAHQVLLSVKVNSSFIQLGSYFCSLAIFPILADVNQIRQETGVIWWSNGLQTIPQVNLIWKRKQSWKGSIINQTVHCKHYEHYSQQIVNFDFNFSCAMTDYHQHFGCTHFCF